MIQICSAHCVTHWADPSSWPETIWDIEVGAVQILRYQLSSDRFIIYIDAHLRNIYTACTFL